MTVLDSFAGDGEGFIALTVKAAAVTTPNTTSQPARLFFFRLFLDCIVFLHYYAARVS